MSYARVSHSESGCGKSQGSNCEKGQLKETTNRHMERSKPSEMSEKSSTQLLLGNQGTRHRTEVSENSSHIQKHS